MVLYPILLSQSWSTTVPNVMLVSGIAQSGQNLALSRLATILVHTTTCKHVDMDNGALSAHLFRCMFSRMPLSSLGLTFKSLLVDLERIYKTLLVMS